MWLTDLCVEPSVFNGSSDKSERKVESLEAHELSFPFVQNTEVSLSQFLGVHCVKLLEETVLEFDPGLRLFIAVPNSVIVSHVSIRPVSMVAKKL